MLAPIRAAMLKDAQLAHLLLRQLRAGGRRRPRELARRSGQPRQRHLADVRSSPALRQQLRRPAQSHRHSVGGLQLPGLQGPRRRHRGLRRGDLQVGRRQRQADHDADRAGRSAAHDAAPTPSRSSSASTSRSARCRRRSSILVGDVTKVPNPRSGKEMLAMTDMAVPVSMKDYGVFAATRSLPMPQGLGDSETSAESRV